MTSGSIFLTTFVCIAAGAAIGIATRLRLPDAHLTPESKEVVRLGAGLIGTLAALVLGLMVASAKSAYDTQISNVRQLAANLILLDQMFAEYGSETKDLRGMLRVAANNTVDRIWHENASAKTEPFSASRIAEEFYVKIETLTPGNDVQRLLKPRILQVGTELVRTRLLLFVHVDNPIPAPFLIILIFWLTVIFISFSLFAEPNVIVVTALLVYAVSVSSALFLIIDLSQPFVGLMQIPSEPLKHVLPALAP